MSQGAIVNPNRAIPRFRLNNVTPFTYRDGLTFLELVEELREWGTQVFPKEIEGIIDVLVTELENANDQYEAGVEEFQRIHDEFMADVNANIVALNDSVVSGMVEDDSTMLGATLREMFETRSRNNVKLFGGGFDGLVAAVNAGGPVQFDETIAHNGNIPNFWGTPIYGSGKIEIPGVGMFTPDPNPAGDEQITNNIFVDSQTGTPTNDGLSPTTALDSVRTAYTKILRQHTAQQAVGAEWVINLKGVFNVESIRMGELRNYPRGLWFVGEPLDGSGRPVTELRYSGSGAPMGLYFEPGIERVYVRNIHFRGWSVEFNGYGVIMKYGGVISVEDCEFSDNDSGVAAIQNTQFSIIRNRFNSGHSVAITTQYNATGGINENTLNGDGDGYGIRVSRGVNAHVDYNNVSGYGRGLYVDMASRAAVVGNTFTNNVLGVNVTSSAEWNNDGNTFTDNSENFRHDGAGKEVRMHSEGAHKAVDFRFFSAHTLAAGASRNFPSLNSRTLVYNTGSIEFKAGWFTNPGKTIRFNISGVLNATNGYSCALEFGTVKADASDWQSFGELYIPTDIGPFNGELVVYAVTPTTQFSKGTMISAESCRSRNGSGTANFNENRYFRVYVRTTGNSDPINIDFDSLDIHIAG